MYEEGGNRTQEWGPQGEVREVKPEDLVPGPPDTPLEPRVHGVMTVWPTEIEIQRANLRALAVQLQKDLEALANLPDPPPAALYSADPGDGNTGKPWISVDSSGNLYVYGNAITTGSGGTGNQNFSPGSLIAAATDGTSALQSVPAGVSGQVLTSNGPGAIPSFSSPFDSEFSWSTGEPLPAGGEITVPRLIAVNSGTPASTQVQLSFWTAASNGQSNYVTMQTGGVPASGLSHAEVGVYSIGSGTAPTFTQLATTGNIAGGGTFGTIYTSYQAALGSGFPRVAGQNYVLAALFTGATTPSLQCASPGNFAYMANSNYAQGNVIQALAGSASSLPATFPWANVVADPNGPKVFQAVLAATGGGTGTGGGGGGGTGSTVLFFDDFTGSAHTLPNTMNWNIHTGPASPDFGSGRQSYYSDSTNILYQDGLSNLIMNIGPLNSNGASGNMWPTSRIDTQGIFALQANQSVEWRVAVTGLAGAWPANWLATENGSYPGTWAEIDLQESGDPNAFQTNYTFWGPGSGNALDLTGAATGTRAYNLDGNYHVYRLDYTGTALYAYIDGALYMTLTEAAVNAQFGTGKWLFSTQGGMYLINDIDVATGLYGTPSVPGIKTIMAIDYVRAWSPAGPYVA